MTEIKKLKHKRVQYVSSIKDSSSRMHISHAVHAKSFKLISKDEKGQSYKHNIRYCDILRCIEICFVTKEVTLVL